MLQIKNKLDKEVIKTMAKKKAEVTKINSKTKGKVVTLKRGRHEHTSIDQCKRFCMGCKVPLTKENSYVCGPKKTSFASYCKACNKQVQWEKKQANKSIAELEDGIAWHRELIKRYQKLIVARNKTFNQTKKPTKMKKAA